MGFFDFLKQKKKTPIPSQEGKKGVPQKSGEEKSQMSIHGEPQKQPKHLEATAKQQEVKARESKTIKATQDQDKEEQAQKTHQSKEDTKTAFQILLRPLVTEKSEKQKKNNVYFFEVGVGANKIMIKEAIRRVYGVHARRVNVMKRMGKHVRFGRFFGKQKDTKRAMVILKQGQSIEF